MDIYATQHGGVGDMLLRMAKPGDDLGYFADLKARYGDEHRTLLEVAGNHPYSVDLFTGMPHIDGVLYTHTYGPQAPIAGFRRLNHSHIRGLKWKAPEIVLDADEQRILAEVTREPYVAVHMFGSLPTKVPPKWGVLLAGLREARIRTILLGSETQDDLPPKLRLHIAVARRARKFIGALSCFNCAAQLAKVPSFVIVNRSLQDGTIYPLMRANRSIIEPWNLGPGMKSIEQIYREAVEWARN